MQLLQDLVLVFLRVGDRATVQLANTVIKTAGRHDTTECDGRHAPANRADPVFLMAIYGGRASKPVAETQLGHHRGAAVLGQKLLRSFQEFIELLHESQETLWILLLRNLSAKLIHSRLLLWAHRERLYSKCVERPFRQTL